MLANILHRPREPGNSNEYKSTKQFNPKCRTTTYETYEGKTAASSYTRKTSKSPMFRSRIFGGALRRDDCIDPTHDVPKGNVRIITSLDLSLLTMVIHVQYNTIVALFIECHSPRTLTINW